MAGKFKSETKTNMYSSQFEFKNLPYADTFDKTLWFSIFDYDRFSKHDQIGDVSHIALTCCNQRKK